MELLLSCITHSSQVSPQPCFGCSCHRKAHLLHFYGSVYGYVVHSFNHPKNCGFSLTFKKTTTHCSTSLQSCEAVRTVCFGFRNSEVWCFLIFNVFASTVHRKCLKPHYTREKIESNLSPLRLYGMKVEKQVYLQLLCFKSQLKCCFSSSPGLNKNGYWAKNDCVMCLRSGQAGRWHRKLAEEANRPHSQNPDFLGRSGVNDRWERGCSHWVLQGTTVLLPFEIIDSFLWFNSFICLFLPLRCNDLNCIAGHYVQ